MTGMAHEAPRPARSSAVIAAWAVLVGMGGTSVTYNVYHATHNGSMNVGLALLYGIAPVFAAALLSHIVAEHDGGRFLQAVTFAVMLGAMTLSIGATAAVVEPAAGPWMQWLFGAVLDAAALVALRVILTGRKRKAEAVTAMEAAERTVAEAERIAAGAAGSVVEAERKTAQVEGELSAKSAELVAANAALEALRAAAPGSRRRRSSGRAPKAAKSAPGSGDERDLTTELRALQMLDAHPELRGEKQGAELARRLGVSAAHGRRLHARLTAEERPADPHQERTAERGDEHTDERS